MEDESLTRMRCGDGASVVLTPGVLLVQGAVARPRRIDAQATLNESKHGFARLRIHMDGRAVEAVKCSGERVVYLFAGEQPFHLERAKDLGDR